MQVQHDPRRRARGMLLVVLVTLLLLGLRAPPSRQAAVPRETVPRPGQYTNPVFSQDYPDPMVMKVGHDYYAYGTTSLDWVPLAHLFPILHSTDLVQWRYVADAFTTLPRPLWSYDDWWAPSVLAAHGRYYLYYGGKDLQTGRHCLAVATAPRPTGPFTHRAVLSCGDTTSAGYIDPAPFLDSDGQAYLYFSVDTPVHTISALRLRPDLLHATGPRVELLGVSQPWERGPVYTTVEGPWLVKHGRLYYLFYSGNDILRAYGMGYATALSPLGPFRKSAHNPILRGTATVVGPGGGSVVPGPHGGLWLVYHAWTGGPGYGPGQEGRRTLRIDPLVWHGTSVGVSGPTTTAEPRP